MSGQVAQGEASPPALGTGPPASGSRSLQGAGRGPGSQTPTRRAPPAPPTRVLQMGPGCRKPHPLGRFERHTRLGGASGTPEKWSSTWEGMAQSRGTSAMGAQRQERSRGVVGAKLGVSVRGGTDICRTRPHPYRHHRAATRGIAGLVTHSVSCLA